MLEIDVSTNTIMRLRSDGKVGINVDDAYMDADSALHVGDGNIVLGNEDGTKDHSLKMIGTIQTTTLKHDSTISITLTSDQADQLNGGGSFTIAGATTSGFPTGTTTGIAVTSTYGGSGAIVDVVMTDNTTIASITVTTAGTGYEIGHAVTITTPGNFRVEVTPTSGASKTPLAIGSNTVALDVSGGSFTINEKLKMTTDGSFATIDSVGADLKLSGNSGANYVEITDESGVKIGLASGNTFKVGGDSLVMDASGKIVMNGDLIISSTTVGGAGNLECDGTGTFGGGRGHQRFFFFNRFVWIHRNYTRD